MPIYEYHCHDCEKEVSIFFLSFSEAEKETAICPECGTKKLERVFSSVSVVKGSRPSGPQAPAPINNTKEDNPKELASTMNTAARSSSADYGDDFREVKSRLEKGESAVSVEKSMRKRVGESMQTH